MAEAGLFIGFGEVARGREKTALQVYSDSLDYYRSLQEEGLIEGFEVVVLGPNGGDLGGFFLLRGTAKQIDSLRRDKGFQRLAQRMQLIVDRLGITDAYVDEGLAEVMSDYQDLVKELH
jgi:hypothetical protein